MDHNTRENNRSGSKPGRDSVTWILIGILAMIALASTTLEGRAQSWAITAGLLVGLVAVIAAMVRGKRNS